MHRLLAWATTALIVLTSFAAEAGVIYRWENLTTNPNFGSATGLLEIAEDQWLAGATVTLKPTFDSDYGCCAFKPFGVENFFFVGAGYDGTYSGSTPVKLSFAPCFDSNFCSPEDFGEPFGRGAWRFDLTFNELLSGSLYASDNYTDVRMASSSDIWTIESFNTDGYPYACYSHQCGGGTGQWVLDRSTVPVASPVPEPETWAMLALGLGVVGGAGWRRKGATMAAPIA